MQERSWLPVRRLREIPPAVWALGFVSLLMDTSSEIIHALLPVYLVTVLGTSMLTVGFIEGIAEATASITKVFSGALSDWLGKRKVLAVIGYGLAAFTKPVFPLASSIGWLVAARFIDRVGKGIRGAPRDALVADIAPTHLRGASFGLRQSLDTVGAFLGPSLAIGLMWLTANNFQAVFWFAVAPAFLALGLLIFSVHEPGRLPQLRKVCFPLSLSEMKHLGPAYWWVVCIAVVFTLGRFSEAFLILRAQAVGLPLVLVPLVLVLMNVVYALTAYPAGVLSDHANRTVILGLGFSFLVAADLVLAFTSGIGGVAAGVALWGLHMGFTQGLLASLVADTAPPELRGTAYGIFNLLGGLSLRVFSPERFGIGSGLRPPSLRERRSLQLLFLVSPLSSVFRRPLAKRINPESCISMAITDVWSGSVADIAAAMEVVRFVPGADMANPRERLASGRPVTSTEPRGCGSGQRSRHYKPRSCALARTV